MEKLETWFLRQLSPFKCVLSGKTACYAEDRQLENSQTICGLLFVFMEMDCWQVLLEVLASNCLFFEKLAEGRLSFGSLTVFFFFFLDASY